MQSFSEFFKVYVERRYFVDAATTFTKMIRDLQQQMKEQGTINPGDGFTLFFSDDDFAEPVTVAFYNGYNKRARAFMRDTGSDTTSAAYYSDGQYGVDTPTIEIYLSKILPPSVTNKFEFIKLMKEPLPSILRHELSHAYEHLVVQRRDGSDTVLNDTGKERQISDPDERYMNNTSEMNAWLQTWVPTLLSKDKLLQHYVQNGDVKNATSLIVNKINKTPLFASLYDKNKNWFYKTIYTMMVELTK